MSRAVMQQALEALEAIDDTSDTCLDAMHELRKALEQPAHKEQLLFEIDGEMLTASQMMGVELFNFQEATRCDTAAEFLAQPEPFKPDYNTEAVLVEEMQRMAKRIEDLEMLLTIRAEQIVGLQDEIRNLTGEE